MNRTGERLAGRNDWLGKTDEELLGGRVAGDVRDHDRAVLEGNTPQLYELEFPAPDGMRMLRSVKFPLRDAQGRRWSAPSPPMSPTRCEVMQYSEAQQKLQTVADARRPAQGRVPRHARARAAQPARPDPQRRRDPRAAKRRRPALAEARR